MNEIEAIKWHLGRYRAVLAQQTDRLYNALEELQRTSLFIMSLGEAADDKIDEWLHRQGFAVDEDGFFQSRPLLDAFRGGTAPKDAVSLSWGKHLRDDRTARQRTYSYRHIGPHLKHLHDRLGDVGWIYYQDAGNTALQYPYIDQRTAIPFDFDWSTYHTFHSVCPANNPSRQIQWTPPNIDYAGEGLILSVSIPVWQDESFAGLWSIDLPIRYLYRDFAASKTFADQEQFIVNDKGMLVLHDKLQAETDKTKGRVFLHPLTELGGQWATLDLATLKDQEEGVLAVTDALGAEWLFCYCHVPGVEWTLFCGLPKASMEEAAAQRLRQAFQQISFGNFSHRIESSPTSALSTLVDEFNTMSLRLSQAEEHREEMEKQLRQAQKMEAVGRLAGGVAHDYNNMTNVILGYADMALEKINKDDPLFADLQEINGAALRSMELTRQLLAFARCQAIAPKVLDINGAVSSMLRMLQRLIGEDIQLEWRPGVGVWPIQIDPTQIDQILANLCVNARDAIDGIGKVTIETANAEFDDAYCSLHRGFIPGQFSRLTVRDNGSGMNQATIDKIFEPFFSTKAIGHGTGLGLATVYGIVQQNQGFIDVFSGPGQGAAFSIYLPRIIGESVEMVLNSGASVELGNNETILLVEDDAAILQMVERMLGQLRYHVLVAKSPLDAIIISENHPEGIDLLLTDVVMPELNGSDLAKRLRDLFPNLAVLFMSGYTANIIAHRGILDKDIYLLQKPFSKKELSIKLKEVLNNAGRR
ncbi:MAG: response regulator [Desulforhopalus sp.]|nr:response regulator [Desulforhopalus sp.]